jgi:hypothetical protein
MKSRIIGKLCSALIFCFLLSLWVHHEVVSRTQMTRQEFLAKQAAKYDKQMAKPAPYVASLVGTLILGGALFAAYELAGFGISMIARNAADQDELS